ncbi:MAG TPA: protein kinase [Pseudomonadota bacterium]|nr:protein kinase [Pseudomonadota bacterium]
MSHTEIEPKPSKKASAPVGEGSELGRYRLLQKLGEGGMGVVFLAEHRDLGRTVAIKVLRTGAFHTEVQATRFQREAEMVTRIGHPNIVEVYDFGRTDDGSLYYVMELLNGESLRSRLRRSPLSDDEISTTFAPLLSAIGAAHDLGIIHRDLKPDNVMIVGDGEGGVQVKLLDFGVAKNLGQPGAGMTTVSGAMLGTPAYMAPEQIRHSAQVDARTDVYSIGVMLYEALAGQRPFSGSPIEVLSKHLYDTLTPPSEIALQKGLNRPKINWPEMDRILARALAKEAEQRYQNVGEFLDELQTAWPMVALPDLSDKSQMNSTHSSGTSIPENARSSLTHFVAKRWWLPVAVVAMLAIGGTAWLLRGSRPLPAKLVEKKDPPIPGKQPRKSVSPAEVALQRVSMALGGPKDERRALAQTIGEVGGNTLQKELNTLLLDEEPAVSKAALQAMGSLGGRADAAMLGALKKLGEKAGGVVGIETMIARMQWGDMSVQMALSASTRSAALDGETQLRAYVVMAQKGVVKGAELKEVTRRSVNQGSIRPSVYRSALRELFRMREPETTKRLNKAIKESNPHLRAEAAEVLALSGIKEGRDVLYELSRTHPEDLSFAALLAASGDVRALETLKPKLEAPSAMIRQKAVASLGRLATQSKNTCDSEQVASLLADADGRVRLSAAVAHIAMRHCEKNRVAATK